MAWKLWLNGLVAAFVSAAAGAGALVIVDPTKFNLFAGGATTLGEVALVLGLASGLNYLKEHPTPIPTKVAAILLMVALPFMGGCALHSARHVATVSVATAHGILATLQDFEKANVCGQPSASAPPACVPADTHKAISAAFVTAFDLDGKVAQVVRATPDTAAKDAAGLLAQISAVVQKILALLPATLQAKAQALLGGL